MRGAWLVLLAGCTADVDTMELRVEPATIDIDVSLGEPLPAVPLHVLFEGRDVTSEATFALDSAALGAVAGPSFVSDGHTGGTAKIAVAAHDITTSVEVTVHVHGVRFVAGAPPAASTWLAPGHDVAVSQPIEPGDGTMVPANLGTLEVDFGLAASDDIHEVSLTAPYVDLHVYAGGAAHVALTPDEWIALSRTARGGTATIEARSTLSGGGHDVHVVTSQVEIADLDARSLVFGGGLSDANGALASTPQLYHYDMGRAAITPFVSQPADGSGCIGCHLAVSRDGRHIAAAGKANAAGTIVGMIIDTGSHAVTQIADTSPWNTGAYDPGGRLLTSWTETGDLILRDGDTAAPITTLALGEAAAGPDISPDGHALVYALMPTPTANNPAGTALRVRSWDATTGTVGPATTVATAAGVLAPQFSSDGAWIVYTRSTEPTERGIVGGSIVRADGSAPPIDIATGAGDQLPRWASAIAPARAGGRDPEPLAWIVFASSRAVAATAMPGTVKSLWIAAFAPARGVIYPPIHLPGQSLALTALHAPYALPASLP